jgi:hypothetical protein
MAQLRSQLEAVWGWLVMEFSGFYWGDLPVVMERHFARALSGNSSPVTTQAMGPHELAKKKTGFTLADWIRLCACKEDGLL